MPEDLPILAAMSSVERLGSVDAVRGFVMIVMALDHVRDFFHRAAMSGASPTDLRVTTATLFLTRWATHICAPVFMLTAGLGAYFYWQRGQRTKAQLSWFLVSRGCWLILLELTVMQLAYNFDVSASYPIFLLVLWVLGACMIVLAALVWLPMPWLAVLSVAAIVLHHLWDGVRVWNLVHQVSVFQVAGRTVIAPYTLVPWFAVMALGFCMGPIFGRAADERRRYLIRIGMGLTIAFVVVRALNIYGDPSPWVAQALPPRTLLSFLNTTKYPPSLSFLLMTLGPALLVWAWLDRRQLSRSNPLVVFGRVPLFYFVLHFFLAHAMAVVMAVVTHGSAAWRFMFQPVPSMGGPLEAFPANFGYDLWVTYAMWVVLVVALYPACLWFAAVKERRREWWLGYL
jgi:uncharacterized membrane protein